MSVRHIIQTLTFTNGHLPRVPSQNIGPDLSRMFLIKRSMDCKFRCGSSRLTLPTSIRLTPSLPLQMTTCEVECYCRSSHMLERSYSTTVWVTLCAGPYPSNTIGYSRRSRAHQSSSDPFNVLGDAYDGPNNRLIRNKVVSLRFGILPETT